MNIKSFLIFIPVILISGTTFGQDKSVKSSLHQRLQHHTDEIFEDLVKIRRDFHRNPEVSGQEEMTSGKIAKYLDSLGLEVKTNIGGYGVVGILNGDKIGRRIAWRADIDAMPSHIPDVVEFKSLTPGVRHICGHDVHTVIALGIANVLTRHKDELAGPVYFVFQPAEEIYVGAKAMIDDGLFNMIKPDEAYALHISPFPVGTISTKPGLVYAHTNKVEVVYKNSGNEESQINRTKELIVSFQNVDPQSKFWNLENLGDPEVGIENPNTIFKDFFTVKEKFDIKRDKDHLTITATLNTDSTPALDDFLANLEDKIRKSELSESLVSVQYSYEKEVVNNDRDLTQNTIKSIKDVYGESSFIPVYGVVTGDRGDDFAYFQKSVPGVYFYLGGANYETGVISMPHAPDFNVDEESIRFGVKYFSSMIMEQLNE